MVRLGDLDLAKIKVWGLFNERYLEVDLNLAERTTILTAPNGYGKTTVLQMIRSLVEGDDHTLLGIPFKEFQLVFYDGASLVARPKATQVRGVEETELEVQALFPPSVLEGLSQRAVESLFGESDVDSDDNAPQRLEQAQQWAARALRENTELTDLGDGRWLDPETGRIMGTGEALRSCGLVLAGLLLGDPVRFLRQRAQSVLYIPDDRLKLRGNGGRGATLEGGRPDATSVVRVVNDLIVGKVSNAIQEYARVSNEVDREFAPGLLPLLSALEAAPLTDEERDELKRRETEVADTEARFERLGLIRATSREPWATRVQDRPSFLVLQRHLEDMQRKLDVLKDVAERLELLQRVVNESFLSKSASFNPESGVTVRSNQGVEIELEKLSSGEQHLLVLFGQMLFCDDVRLVLIDEPEMSLHLAWQERFLEYLSEAQRLAGFTAILATHSPSIVWNRWDLTVELAEATRVVDEV